MNDSSPLFSACSWWPLQRILFIFLAGFLYVALLDAASGQNLIQQENSQPGTTAWQYFGEGKLYHVHCPRYPGCCDCIPTISYYLRGLQSVAGVGSSRGLRWRLAL